MNPAGALAGGRRASAGRGLLPGRRFTLEGTGGGVGQSGQGVGCDGNEPGMQSPSGSAAIGQPSALVFARHGDEGGIGVQIGNSTSRESPS